MYDMEKVDLAPLRYVILTPFPDMYDRGIMMWCRRCGEQIAEQTTQWDFSYLPDVVHMADAHQEFYCPRADGEPSYDFAYTHTRAWEKANLRREQEMEMIIQERIKEALGAQRFARKS